MEKVGLKEFYYRRVVYIDTENDLEANTTNTLRIVNFSACCLTAVLLIPRYWQTLKMLKATHRVPEGTSLFLSPLLGWLILEMLICLIHSPPSFLMSSELKLYTYENTVVFNDKFGRE